MAHHFYAQPLGPCAVCGRPATHVILGPGNEEYTKACGEHAEREVLRLTEAWDRNEP